MAKFVYGMQNVLNIKERLEAQAKSDYAQANGRLMIEEETMRRLVKRLEGYELEAKRLAKDKLDIAAIRRCSDAIENIKGQITSQAVRIRIAQKNVDAAMEKLTEAMQERKIHEKLKEKAFEDFKHELNATEMKEIDEVVSFNYNNRDEF